jgi:glycosyltransferase involved in cell wall biosynthesis
MRKLKKKIFGGVIHLRPSFPIKGYVLLSYITYPFLVDEIEKLTGHTNYWEAWRMAQEFLKRGYAVDVIDADNNVFVPRRPYQYFIDIHSNLERLAPTLPKSCVKILHLTTTHWLFNNMAEYRRLYNLFMRRNAVLLPERLLPPTRSHEYADILLLLGLGSTFTLDTYGQNKARVFTIPISTTFTYPAPEKNFVEARNGFVWIGGAGLVHKGVDLILEAFARTPEYRLELCGKLSDKNFERVYQQELAGKNIHQHGMLDLSDQKFDTIRTRSAFVLSASCAEGQSGSVIIGMHAGLIPIVSKESGIDTRDFGFTLPDDSVETLEKTLRMCAALPIEELARRSRAAWEYARTHHTREHFAEHFTKFVDELIEKP